MIQDVQEFVARKVNRQIAPRWAQQGLHMVQSSSNDGSSPVVSELEFPSNATFRLGDRVRKKSGAAWQGRVVGWYSTSLTPEGYAVESESHSGSVQIYPVAALERVA
jgi:dihydrofolate reductase (trimethoprim resistance protein)